MSNSNSKNLAALQVEMEELRHQLFEAHETIEAIRTGQVDALVVQSGEGHQLYTLKTADQAYRVFIEKMNEGAITLNQDGIILYCNSQFASMISKPLSEVIGTAFSSFVAEEDKVSFQQTFHDCWTADCKQEIALRNLDYTIPVQLSLTALELQEGVALSIILTDLTAQKKAQGLLEDKNRQLAHMNQALESSNHDLQQFASVASHDLQEPLRKIQMFSNILTQKSNGTLLPEQKNYLEKIVDSAGRMKTLIVDVLNYSKLSANDNVFEQVHLNELVKELLEDFELLIQEKEAVINVSQLPVIEANRGQIRQVFQNIISNALKFVKTGQPPRIHLTAKRLGKKSFTSTEDASGPYCLLSIKDEGIGFNEKYLANIFALFERLHSKDSYEGTGIGLAITKKIIEKHNGLVSAKSSEGKGSEFLLLLPVTQEKNSE